MVTLLIHHRVGRGLDDPQLAVITETYDSRDDGEWSINHRDLAAVLVECGVELESARIDYLEEL